MSAAREAQLCGRPGQLYPFGGTPEERHACLVWRTDLRLLGASAGASSLYALACDVAELYHRGLSVQLLGEGRRPCRTRFKVMWLEFTAEDALLVFLRPTGEPQKGSGRRAPSAGLN